MSHSLLILILIAILSVRNRCAAAQYYKKIFIGSENSAYVDLERKYVNFSIADQDSNVKICREMLASAPANNNTLQKKRLKQALLVAQESLLPNWAKWKSFRPSSASNPFEDDGSYKDWKTSTENDSNDSLTWLNEFFHPDAFVRRPTRFGQGGLARKIFFQDYDPLTGTPVNEELSQGFFDESKEENKNFNVTFERMSTLDQRPERTFLRQSYGPCRYSVPYFAEPLLLHEEGVHFFVTSNANLLTTSFTPCVGFCEEYAESGMDGWWPGVYLITDDLDPSIADRSVPPLNTKLSPFDIDDGPSAHNTQMADIGGFSGIWIDRYVYKNASTDEGVATHSANANAKTENLLDMDRQVSVVVTYENIPAAGIKESKSNFTAQIEIFTNGTIIMRFRSLCPKPQSSNSTSSSPSFFTPLIDPILNFGEDITQFTGLERKIFNSSFDEYNNTDLRYQPIVSIRYDLLSLAGTRSAQSIKTKGRCGKPTTADTLIPPGHRSSHSPCEDKTNAQTCLTSGSCAWCSGMYSSSELSVKDGQRGLCMSPNYINFYCSPPNLFRVYGSPPDSEAGWQGDFMDNMWEYYNVTVINVLDRRDPQLLDLRYKMNVPQKTFEPDRFVAAALASTLRHRHPTDEFVTRNPELYPRSLILTKSQSKAVYRTSIPTILRRQMSDRVSERMQNASLTVFSLTSRSADCFPSDRSFYGESPLHFVSSRFQFGPFSFQLQKEIPTFVRPIDRTITERRAVSGTFKGTVHPGQHTGVSLYSNLMVSDGSGLDNASLQLFIDSQLGFNRSEQHVCILERLHRMNYITSGIYRYVTGKDRTGGTNVVGQFDIFFEVSSSGSVTIGCLTSTAPTLTYFDRMISGTDPFNTWYLQEAVPLSSTFVQRSGYKNLFATLNSPAYFPGRLRSLSVPASLVLRPGRLVTFSPKTLCPRCIHGVCDRATLTCICNDNYNGFYCTECSVRGYFYDKLLSSCQPCINPYQAPECLSASFESGLFSNKYAIIVIPVGVPLILFALSYLVFRVLRHYRQNNNSGPSLRRFCQDDNTVCNLTGFTAITCPVNGPVSSAPKEFQDILHLEEHMIIKAVVADCQDYAKSEEDKNESAAFRCKSSHNHYDHGSVSFF